MSRKEKLLLWLAWRLPHSLVYWCGIRLITHASTGEYRTTIVPELGAVEALKRWGEP